MKIACGACVLALALSAVPAEAALIHHYQFDSDVSDSAGSEDGTLMSGAAVVGGELILTADGDFVEFGSFLVPTSGDFTIALFAREFAPDGAYMELISQGNGFYFGRSPGAGGDIRASDSWISTGVGFPMDDLEHHYALVKDSAANETRLYIDGLLQATLAAALPMPGGGTNTRLGRQFNGHAEYLQGSMEDVRIYDDALTAEQIGALANPQGEPAPVPEPSTWALMLTGAAGLALARRRRK